MKTSVLPMLWGLIFLFAGCAETRITGFRDPAFRDVAYEDIVVMAHLGDLIHDKIAEDYFVQCLSKKKVRARPSTEFFPPTREIDQQETLRKLKGESVEALLIISIKDRWTDTRAGKGTGYAFLRETHALQLIDVKSGRMAWTASASSDSDGSAGMKEMLSSLATKTTATLAEEGFLRPHKAGSPIPRGKLPPQISQMPAPGPQAVDWLNGRQPELHNKAFPRKNT